MVADRQPGATTLRAERVLDVLGFVLADVRYGLGPYGVVYLIGSQGWDEAGIALAFGLGGVAGLVAQAPIGALVDRMRSKRALAAMALLLVAGACLAIPLAPGFWPVALGAVAGALANVTLGTTLAAISLGVVGPARFARRAARNEVFFHAGSAAVNLAVLGLAPLFGVAVVFWLLAGAALFSLFVVAALPGGAINQAAARGLEPGAPTRPGLRTLMGRPGLLAFAGCGALFHMANGSMLALMLQRAARLDVEGAVALAAAAMIVAQGAMIATALLAGMRADRWGRRPFFIAAFVALALRGGVFALTTDPAWIVAAQLLDGIGVGVFGALFPVLIADLTRGSGHFGAAQGLVGTVHGIGGLVGGPLSAACVVFYGYGAAFLLCASIAACGAVAFAASVAETAGPRREADTMARRRKLLRHP